MSGHDERAGVDIGSIGVVIPSTFLIAQDDASGGAALVQFAILLMIPVALYFLMIRPQRRRMRETAALQSSLGVGDEVVTSSGLYGFITGVEDDLFWIEIDEDVQVRVARSAVQGRVSSPAADDATDTSA